MILVRAGVAAQAHLMLQRLDAVRPGAVDRLHTDALTELGTWTDIQMRRVPDTATLNRCSVAGGYVHTTRPPTLTITESQSVGRQQFTALHELGHHLQKNDARLALAVRRQPVDREAFEDAACDLFASRVLITDDDVPQADGRAPSAADVVALFEQTQASRAACCVRLAGQLGTHGVVAVLDPAGTVSFATAHGEIYPPARGSSQAATPLVAAALRRRSEARVDNTYILYRAGHRGEVLYGDAAWAGDYLIMVAVLDRPSWKQFAPPRTDRSRFVKRDVTCEVCGEEFPPDGTCATCGTPRCSSGHCTCTLATERQCQGCFQLLGPARFASRTNPVCKDCAD